MRGQLWLAVILLVAACRPSQTATVPTLAVLPTIAVATQQPPPRPTLPPTFTPTALPTNTPAPPTATPPATLRVIPANVLGSPLTNPDNFPVSLGLSGGHTLNLNPPPTIRYRLREGVYRLSVAYADSDETLTLHLAIRAGLANGDHIAPYCSGPGNALPAGTPLCLSALYTDANLIAANTDGATVTLTSLDPLQLTARAGLPGALIPNPRHRRYNSAPAAELTLEVAGQPLTEGS